MQGEWLWANLPAWMWLAAVAVFALAGMVKGVVGLGLPTVSMALLALWMPAGQAAAWLLLPSLVTNVLQMRPLASLLPVWRRLWPMQLGVVCGTLGLWWWGPVGQLAWAKQCLGAALVAYALWGLWGRVVTLPAALPRGLDAALGSAVGLATGVITAMTGVFVVPAVAYLQALHWERQVLMQAMGLSFTISTLALGVGLSQWGGASNAGAPLDAAALTASAAMLAPAWLGMAVGERLRARCSPAVFKRVLMASLLLLGAYMVVA